MQWTWNSSWWKNILKNNPLIIWLIYFQEKLPCVSPVHATHTNKKPWGRESKRLSGARWKEWVGVGMMRLARHNVFPLLNSSEITGFLIWKRFCGCFKTKQRIQKKCSSRLDKFTCSKVWEKSSCREETVLLWGRDLWVWRLAWWVH